MWLIAGLAGALVVATGWLPLQDARVVALDRGGPVLGFLIAIAILAVLADRAGVFDVAAHFLARIAGGSTWRLYLFVGGLATMVTAAMSLDTTAVLLTPVVLSLAKQLSLRAEPFAMLVVWLANAASLLLPVSNLTNLLALQHAHMSTLAFARAMAVPSLVAVVLTVAYLCLVYRKDLRGDYAIPAPAPPKDRWTFGVCTAACGFLVVGVVAGAPPWAAATASALVAIAVFIVRAPSELTGPLFPWRLVVAVEGLFVTVAAMGEHGLTALLRHLVGVSTWQTTVVSTIASNGINNLPAYLVVEPAIPVGQHRQLLAALIGTNAGPLVLLWGSLATLLWRDSCRLRGLVIPVRRFVMVGLGGVPLVTAGAWVALVLLVRS
jgi:arsenical pump membrane protein